MLDLVLSDSTSSIVSLGNDLNVPIDLYRPTIYINCISEHFSLLLLIPNYLRLD